MIRPGLQWTDKAGQDAVIAEFKKPLGWRASSEPVAFLIVRTMLLTASTPRSSRCSTSTASSKTPSYCRRSLASTAPRRQGSRAPGRLLRRRRPSAESAAGLRPEDADDTMGALTWITDELPKLRDRHARVVAIFTQAGIETSTSMKTSRPVSRY